MAAPMLAAVGASAGLDVLSGLFGYFAGEEASAAAESRARMIRMEAEVDAQRYGEQADRFKATQKLAYLKSGVELSGSPLDVLTETALTARENLSAIRAGADARAFEAQMEGVDARMKGRAALIGGFAGAGKTAMQAGYSMNKNSTTATTPRNNTAVAPAWKGVPYL